VSKAAGVYSPADPAFPFGMRGARPIALALPTGQAASFAASLPGAMARGDNLHVGLDLLPPLMRFGVPPPDVRFAPVPYAPEGLRWYAEQFQPIARPHQPAMAEWLAQRSFAINADPMRSGKTFSTLAAVQLVGARQVLVVCPAIAKGVWAREIARWLGEPSLLLDGRRGDEARLFCVRCHGTGREGERRCSGCRARNGSTYGYTLISPAEIDAALSVARFIIVNYDLLTPQTEYDGAGKRGLRHDLPGWVDRLLRQHMEIIIADEAHLLRGRTEKGRRGLSRRDRLRTLAKPVPRVWALTGTPIYGRTADLYGLLDVLHPWGFGSGHDFDLRYAAATHNGFGWEAKGSSNEEELRLRLATFMLKRTRSEIAPGMAPKTRHVVHLDPDKLPVDVAKPQGLRDVGQLHAALRRTAEIKEGSVVEAALDACAEGERVVIFTYLRAAAESMAAAVTKRAAQDARIDKEAFRVWHVDGSASHELRGAQARALCAHSGPGVFVATMDSIPVAIALAGPGGAGASQVLFADLHVEPATLLQAEDRALVHGVGGLTVTYFVVDRTVDEHVVALVLPKMAQLEVVTTDEEAAAFRTAFQPEVLAATVWERMLGAAEQATG